MGWGQWTQWIPGTGGHERKKSQEQGVAYMSRRRRNISRKCLHIVASMREQDKNAKVTGFKHMHS